MGTLGDAFDNAVIESVWARLQTELLNRKKWRTRIELSTALFEYLEIFHNRSRRHSSLGMLTPIEYENGHNQRTTGARLSDNESGKQGHLVGAELTPLVERHFEIDERLDLANLRGICL